MKSDNITVTQGRIKQAFDKGLGGIIEDSTSKIVEKEVEKSKIRTGTVTKFYPYLDKAEVKLDNLNKTVSCRILHRFGGELIDYFTPNGDFVYDEIKKEKCIIPRGNLHCFIMKIHDSDSNEWLLLGYFSNEELLGVNPASEGNFKIVTRGGTNQFWIKFGYDGLDLRLPESVKINSGEMDEDMVETNYAESDNVYTKLEIDEKLKEISVDIDFVEVVATLPSLCEDVLNKIYLVISQNGFDVYLPYVNNENFDWLLISSSSPDTYTKQEIDDKLSLKSDSNHVHSQYLTSHQDVSGKEDKSNKSSSITADTGSTTKYPTVKAVEDYAQPKGNINISDVTNLQTILNGKSNTNHSHNIWDLDQTTHSGINFLSDGTDKEGYGFDIAGRLYYNEREDKLYYDKNGSIDYDDGNELATVNDIPSLGNYVQKSQTVGLIKNDGTIDTTDYVNTNDSRLSDSRTPKSHNHGNLQNNGIVKVNGTAQASKNVCTDANGYITTENKNNHTHSQYLTEHQSLENYVQKETGKGLSSNDFTNSEKEKLEGIEENANNYTHPSYTPKSSGLYKVTVDNTGHVSDATAVAKADITALGIPSTNSTYTPASATPLADASAGVVGTSAKYAREDHKHPKSSLYAESSHIHTDYNKATYEQTVASTATGAYEIGKITVDGAVTTLYGKDTNTEYTHPTYSNVAKSTSKLYKIKTNSLGHIIEITEATSTDIANLGVKITDTVYTHPSYTSKASGLYKITVDGTGHISGTASVSASDLPSHSHTVSNISDFPSIPSKTSDLTNDSGFITSHQDISGKEDKSNKTSSWNSSTNNTRYPTEKLVKDSLDGKLDKTQTSYKGKNVVVDSTSGAITFENKPTIPSAASATPLADASAGAVGTGTTWARADHIHPKSSLYAEEVHAHKNLAKTEITSGDLNNYTTTGWYSYSTSNNVNIANIPPLPAACGCMMEVFDDYGNGKYVVQIVYSLPSDKKSLIFYRQKNDAQGWGDWEQLSYSNNAPEYVVGTHGTTATSTWTGTCTRLNKIQDGTIIFFYLTSAGTSTSVTLNLTLANGTTTGAKNVYSKGTTRLTTHYPINSIVTLVYTTKKDSGAWYVASANDNSSWNATEYGGVQTKCGGTITSGALAGAKASDKKYYTLASGLVLDTSYPIVQYSTNRTSSDGNTNQLYNKRYELLITTTKSMTLTAPNPVYIEGTSYKDGKFTVSSNVLTQSLTNGRFYWLIGFAYDSTHIRFGQYEKIWYYDGTNLAPVVETIDSTYYRYSLSSSKYDVDINDVSYTITAKVVDSQGNPVSGRTLVLLEDGNTMVDTNLDDASTKTTNNNGIATWEIPIGKFSNNADPVLKWGLFNYNIQNTDVNCQVYIDGWYYLNGSSSSSWALMRNKNYAKLVMNGWSPSSDVTTSWVQIGSSGMALDALPYTYFEAIGFVNTTTFYIRIKPSGVTGAGNVEIRCGSGTISKTNQFYLDTMWAIKE